MLTSALPAVRRTNNEADLIKLYKHRLDLADRKFNLKKPYAEKALKRYRNEVKVEEITPSGHRVSVPTGTAIIDALFSSMTAVEVDVVAENIGTGSRTEAKVAQNGIRDVWREQKVDREGESAIKEALIVGIGWLKTDYEYHEETFTKTREAEDVEADIDKLFSLAESARMVPPTPDQVAEIVPLEEEVTEVIRDRIVIDHVPWDEVRWDPTAKRVRDIRWVCQVTKLPAREVRENPVYQQFVKAHREGPRRLRDIKADSVVTIEIPATLDVKETTQIDDDDLITVYEFWDFETGMVSTFSKSEDLLLYQRPNPFMLNEDLIDKSPFVPLVLRKDPSDVWGLSDMQLVMPSLDELTEYRSNLATYIARTVPKILGVEGTLTEAGKKALLSKEWGSFVEMTQGTSVSDIKDLVPPQLPQEVFNVPDRIENQIREATGVNELMRGIFPDRRRTATETTEVVAASASRQSEKRNLLERFYTDIARRILQLMQMFYDQPRVARLVEDIGDVVWEYTAEDIVGEMKLACYLTPKEAKTDQAKRDRALATANLLSTPILAAAVDPAELARFLMEEMGWPDSVIRNIIKLPEEQQAEQEQQVALAGETAMAESMGSAAGQSVASIPGITGAAPMAVEAANEELEPQLV